MSSSRLTRALSVSLACNAVAKREFHLAARQALKRFATHMHLQPRQYEIRSNQGGIAVSGEVTLHHDQFYIQVSQGALGHGHEVLVRTCTGQRDYTGGPNRWVSIETLEDLPAMAGLVTRMISAVYRGAEAAARAAGPQLKSDDPLENAP